MVETIEMDTGEHAIVLDQDYARITEPNQLEKNKFMIGSSSEWHQISIHHRRKCAKKDIIPALYHVVRDEFFFPIAYRQGREEDKFFVNCQEKALLRFFDNKLIVNVRDIPIKITMKVAVSLFRPGQIKPLDKLKEVVNERFINRSLHGSVDVLNLDSLSTHGAMQEIIVDLSNISCLSLLINAISLKKQIKDEIKTLKLAKNNLKNLIPFDIFHNMNIKVLDLTYNKISSFNEFHHLEKLQLKELFIIGNNDICRISGYQEKLKEILPTLNRVDDMCFETLNPINFDDEAGPSGQSTTKVYINGNEPIVHLSDGELIKPSDVNKHTKELFKKYKNSDLWHCVILQHGGKATKDEMLNELFVMCDAFTFFPCYYKEYQKHDEFFIRNCFDALHQMIENDLFIKLPNTSIITMVLKMKVADFREGQIDCKEKMNFVLQGQFSDGLLNLNELSKNCEFGEMILPMSTKGCVSFILNCACEQFGSKVERITMQNTGLISCEGFIILPLLKKVTYLDLRNNNIKSLLGFPKSTKISEIFLDGNPICENYKKCAADYVHHVRPYFAYLTTLDKRKLDPLHDFVNMRNYLVTPDGHAVVENFIQLFFTTYDSFERKNLKELYVNKSIFSLSTYYEMTMEELSNADDIGIIGRIKKYVDFSRNILKNHGLDNFVIGYQSITDLFNILPKTQHDMASFQIDVPLFTKNRIVVTVSGVFRELGNSLIKTELIMGFTRTFVLLLRDKQKGLFKNAFKYSIYNDQLSITNINSDIKRNSFIHRTATEVDFKKHCKDLIPSELEERDTKIRLFNRLTELTFANCEKYEIINIILVKLLMKLFHRYMTDQNWDLDAALFTFITLMKAKSIPASDFDF
ncbi:unnamed protein product [Diamesa serratosioi]